MTTPATTPLETARLELRAATPDELLGLIDGAPGYEDLRAFFVSGDVQPEWVAALRAAAGGGPDPWRHGFFVAERGSSNVVGFASFKGQPDSAGMVEIAYGIVPRCQSRGYATEAAAALVRFAEADARVKLLRAHTLAEENASTKVLTKCGFSHVGGVLEPDDGPVWRWERSPRHIGAR